MGIEYRGDVAHLSGVCDVTEALEFSEWLSAEGVARAVHLEGAAHLNLAVYQCIRYFRPEIISQPKDEFLASLVDDLPDEQVSKEAEGK